MSTFRTSLRIVWGHRLYVLIYLVFISMLGVLAVGGASSSPDAEETGFIAAKPTVAVIDRDGSDISRGITEYVCAQGTSINVADDERSIQDAAAEDRASYVLVIPAGYGDALMDAAATGDEVPSLETVVSYQSSAGTLMDLSVRGYLQSAYGFAATVASSQADVVRLASDAAAEKVSTTIVATEAEPLSSWLLYYFQFATYPIFASVTMVVAVLMNSLNERDVRMRSLAAPITSVRRSFQTFLACCVMGLVAWAWICLVGFALNDGAATIATAPVQVALMCGSLLAYSLVSVTAGFLVGQLGVGEMAANAISNVAGMALSFLGGGWVQLALMPTAVQQAARFFPSYWSTTAANDAFLLTETSGAAVAGVLGEIGVVCLFAVAIFAVSLVIGRSRMRA
jgi:ABC-2 type transport system permease protein